ncbi:NADPH-dependent F420 reductase [Mesorhizobium microcysteis]|uniref:NADPH-dependent F420 reductase n=1 Tax=Neoaquamicrobium microcysteis TaxID=2682781 RepID=A0A5D4HA48_9HYPH|nr:NADPH-dependent F420 reductase [Mesorhizobium microcysteis]TYR35660.1 NADPH-dependent F420 reductase [Mesorhizobium microcysteis]
MDISIIGTGNMAKGFAGVFAEAGHQVTVVGRDKAKAQAVANEIGHEAKGGAFDAAGNSSDVTFLAVPYDAAVEIVSAGGFDGRIVVDVTNPMKADFSGLAIGHSTSAAEEIQNAAPRAKVVKAFNTVFASVLANGGKAAGKAATVFVAGDDEDARRQVAALAKSAGFRAVETGGLASARLLEPVAALNIALGYGLGHGTDIAPAWQGIS